MDGTDCFKYCLENPTALYRTFIIDQVHGATRSILEAKLCAKEKYRQSQHCTIYQGLNGTVDFMNDSHFCRDYKNKVTQFIKSTEMQLRANQLKSKRIKAFINTNLENDNISSESESEDDLKQSQDKDESIIRCKCTNLMIKIKLRDIYPKGAFCDECNRSLHYPHMFIYHCPIGNNIIHKEGFDLCVSCATNNLIYNEELLQINHSSSDNIIIPTPTKQKQQLWMDKHGAISDVGYLKVDMDAFVEAQKATQDVKEYLDQLQLDSENESDSEGSTHSVHSTSSDEQILAGITTDF